MYNNFFDNFFMIKNNVHVLYTLNLLITKISKDLNNTQ